MLEVTEGIDQGVEERHEAFTAAEAFLMLKLGQAGDHDLQQRVQYGASAARVFSTMTTA